MSEFQLLVDLHKGQWRQGPGGDDETRRAIELAGLDGTEAIRVADIGCGTGSSTILLAEELNAQVTGVDLFPDFLQVLESRARERGVDNRISTVASSMEDLPFGEGEFDVIWSEGAVYNMGFEKGIGYWRRFLEPGGVLAVSEITWLTASRPEEIEDYWMEEYPEIDRASAKMATLERLGYSPVGYFVLPLRCWTENYYEPLKRVFSQFLQRKGESEEARRLVEGEEQEIGLYERYHRYYGYGFYVARRTS